MTKQEYNLKLKNCQEAIQEGQIEDIPAKLDDLYQFKPVRLEWYVAKAAYLWKIGEPLKTVFDCLAGKGWYLYNYPGMKEFSDLYIKLLEKIKNAPDILRHQLLYLRGCDVKTPEEEQWLSNVQSDFKQAKRSFLNNPQDAAAVKILLDFYFSFQDYIMFSLLASYIRQEKLNIEIGRKPFLEFSNSGYLTENLDIGKDTSFLLIEDEYADSLDYEVAVFILQKLHKKIYFVKAPIPIEIDHEVDISATVEASMDSTTADKRTYTIYPAEVICNGNSLGDNREYILDYLIQNEFKENIAVIITSGIIFDNLCGQSVLKKSLERLGSFSAPTLESQVTFGWIGDYLSYINQIHDIDARTLLEEPATVSYSIIVPARNSAATLRYTLMTCLNQRYKGAYEIVLSDNSTPGNTEVYQLYKELNDPRIKYYRTPREFNLSRSFEFAFLHAKGEFLLSIGSDDAILPWALEVLDTLRKKYPDEEIIQWERGFYVWPGFNGGQQNQFVIPRGYRKDELQAGYCTQSYYFGSILKNSAQMYLLPNLYLNSGCQRKYLKKILDRTGRLFDGICQDIYMGVVDAAINEKILSIKYPLTIAGMSASSMGAKANMIYQLKEDEKDFLNDLKKTGNIGGYNSSFYERLMPEVTTDKSSLYNCLLRMIARGVIAETDLEQIDFREWFLDVCAQMDIRDSLFDKKIHYFRYTASLHGEEFLRWFDESIYCKVFSPRKIDEEKLAKLQQKKCYIEGIDEYGGRTIDASKYDVKNIYEAAKLFEEISEL